MISTTAAVVCIPLLFITTSVSTYADDWLVETIDSDGAVGRYSSLALDSAGNPCIAYQEYYPYYRLKYAHYDGTDWNIEIVKEGSQIAGEIALDIDDPLLTVLQIGDLVRVEGNITEEDDHIVIVVVNIIFINVEVYIGDDDQVWRDPGNCANAPPPWAPAHGWHRRCDDNFGGGGDYGGGSGSHS